MALVEALPDRAIARDDERARVISADCSPTARGSANHLPGGANAGR
jgi:hypothetical protein